MKKQAIVRICKAIVCPPYCDKPHRCWFTAQDNGFCHRHDPRRRLATLLKREAKLKDDMIKINAEVQKLKGGNVDNLSVTRK